MRRTIIAGLLLLLGGCQGSGGDSKPPPPPSPPSPALTLTVRDPGGWPGPFAIDLVEEWTIEVRYAHLTPGAHAVRVDVMSPGGTLYAQLPIALDVNDQGTGSATYTLQVRGTTIQSFRQVGSWQFAASLDGSARSAAAVDVTG